MTPLRAEMIRQLQLKRLAENTQLAYVRAVEGLARHYWRPPDQLTTEQVNGYLHHLLVDRELSWSSCNVASCGIAFFLTKVAGRAESFRLELPPRTRPKKLPEVLSREEVESLFAAAGNRKHRMLLMTTYGGGLRVSEVVRLKTTDVDGNRMTIWVRQGKGFKDRRTVLSAHLLQELRAYWRIERLQGEWLFPGGIPGRPLTRGSASKIYDAAKRKAGITRGHGIHTLRHCFATHMLESGVDSTVIQSMLGHSHISTTARYLHVSQRHLEKIKSPLDAMFPAMPSPAGS